jgi:hypothetical protein
MASRVTITAVTEASRRSAHADQCARMCPDLVLAATTRQAFAALGVRRDRGAGLDAPS